MLLSFSRGLVISNCEVFVGKRTSEEVDKLIKTIQKKIADGMDADSAIKSSGINSKSTYYSWVARRKAGDVKTESFTAPIKKPRVRPIQTQSKIMAFYGTPEEIAAAMRGLR